MTINGAQEIAVVGATGVVGRELLAALEADGQAPDHLTALASERSGGEEMSFAGESIEVEKLGPDSFRGVSLALFAVPPDVARTLAPAAQAAGAWVVDVSPAFRSDPTVPLVLPPVNGAVLRAPFKGRIVSTPSPVTTALALILAPLEAAGLAVKQVQLTALVGASSQGLAGVAELEAQTAALLSGRDPEATRFPHRLGFNLVPHVGELDATSAWSSEERSWRAETQRLFTGGGPAISGTAIQVPTFYGHGLSIALELRAPASEEQVRSALKGSSALKVLDTPGEKIYPMPMLVTADTTVHVGRIRAVPDAPGWVLLFATIDNAGRGAAVTAVEVGRALQARV